MGKKKMVLYGVAALLAVSGVVALPSGNITGGIGCIVIAAVCFLAAGRKGHETEGQQKEQTRTVTQVSSGKVVDTIRTKIVGVTFENEDGENRQDILGRMSGNEEIGIEKYTYNGKPAAYVKWGNKILGNLSAELAEDLARKYPNARYTAEILEISGGGVQTFGCNIEIDIVEEQKESTKIPASEAYVYVDRSSKKYHVKPNCSGMKNPKAIPISRAKSKYTPCKKCCK